MAESQNIEYKSSWRDEYLKWICGFANANGGKLYIGIDDNENIVGVNDYKKLLEDLPSKFRNILGVFTEINLHTKDKRFYIEIIVPRYDVPISFRGKYYIRTGSTLQELVGPSLNEFILRRTGKTWDDIVEQKASLMDIDKSTVDQFLKDAQKARRLNVEDNIELEDLLEKLRLSEGGQLKRAAIILFGKDPGKFYPNLAIKIGKFGESDADLRFHEVADGNIVQLKERVGDILNAKFFIRPIDFVGMQRVEKDEYPVAAIREMILNALVHRSYMGAPTQVRLYENHFSIWNDGGLPDGITEEDLKRIHRSKPRNPLIADICFKAGYIDSWGRGTIKIVEACEEAGLPEPVLREEQGGFLSMVYKTLPSYKQLSDSHSEKRMLNERRRNYGKNYGRNTEEVRKKYGRNAEEIISFMKGKPEITIEEIAIRLNKSSSTIEKIIRKLREAKLVKRVGSTKAGYWQINP